MLKKSILKLTKRASVLAVILMSGAAVMLFGSKDVIPSDNLLVMIIVGITSFSFFYVVWPAFKEAEKIIESREEKEDEMFP